MSRAGGKTGSNKSDKALKRIATVKGARAAAFPASVNPMLASLPAAAGSFARDGFIFEPKLDGIRCLALIENGKARLLSRRQLDLTSQYPLIAEALPGLVSADCILDGEIIALTADGRPSFQLLQQRMNLTRQKDVERAETRVPVQYFVFDILRAGGYDLTHVRLRERKEILAGVLSQSDRVRQIRYFEDDGLLAYEACVENGFEGVVAKRLDSLYECGRRSPSWLKVKAQQTAEFVIGGYTPGQGSRATTFGALLLGYYDSSGSLIYCGSVGTGFDGRLLREMLERLNANKRSSCPFANRPADKKDALWVNPAIVIEAKYMDLTRDEHLRTPVFLRFRDDKDPGEVRHPDSQKLPLSTPLHNYQVVSMPESTPELMVAESPAAKTSNTSNTSNPSNPAAAGRPGASASAAHSTAFERLAAQLSGKELKMELLVDNERLSVTSLDRPFWPAYGEHPAFTKRDYLLLLCAMAPWLLPHWRGRPLTLLRAPDGVGRKSFFQKHWKVGLPEFVETVMIESEGQASEYLLCNNLPSLLFFGQHSVLEFHSFLSRITEEPDSPDKPDWIDQAGRTDRTDRADRRDRADGRDRMTPPDPANSPGTAAERAECLLKFPDYLIIDLDYHEASAASGPDSFDRDAFKRTCEVAYALKEYLEAVSLETFLKTSGRNGLHIFVPVKRNVDFETTKTLAETIVLYMARIMPDKVTVDLKISKRGGKVFLDCSANGAGKNIVAPYSPRLVPWAAISTPIFWGELEYISPVDLSLYTMAARLATTGDPWKEILSSKHDLHSALSKRNTK